MKASIKINDKKAFKVDTSMRWLRIYRDQFGHDILPDIIPIIDAGIGLLSDALNGSEIDFEKVEDELYGLEFITINQVIWSLAKNAEDIPDIDEWEASFDKFPLDEILPQIVDLLATTYISTKKLKPLKDLLKQRRFQQMNSLSPESTEG